MTTETGQPTITFPGGYDALWEYETPLKGYLSGVVVQLPDGPRYELFFIDPIRLQQEPEWSAQVGDPFFTEPNMIILPEVTAESIRQAVDRLARQHYFQQMKPL
jgi:hypothetical protein